MPANTYQQIQNVLILTIILSGDIELNPGPHKKASVYPCGLCELPVKWNCQGVCCDILRQLTVMMRMFFFTGVSYGLLLRYDLGEFLVDLDLVEFPV
jgi:hypothetical protein